MPVKEVFEPIALAESVFPFTGVEVRFKLDPFTEPLTLMFSMRLKHGGSTRCMIPEILLPDWFKLEPPRIRGPGFVVETPPTFQLPEARLRF